MKNEIRFRASGLDRRKIAEDDVENSLKSLVYLLKNRRKYRLNETNRTNWENLTNLLLEAHSQKIKYFYVLPHFRHLLFDQLLDCLFRITDPFLHHQPFRSVMVH